jgi:hypothetical protein
MAEDYTRGQMDISHHKATYDAVMKVSVFISVLLGLIVLYLTLVFGANMNWITALIASLIAGGATGAVLKQGARYWASLGLLAVIALISGAVTLAFAGA